MWFWSYYILKDKDKYWVTELFYESKYKKTPKKITWYIDFIFEWKNKTDLLNMISRLINWKDKLDNWYDRYDYIMMKKDIKNIKKNKIIDIKDIKFIKKI